MNAVPALVSIVIHSHHSVWPRCSLIGWSMLLRVGGCRHLHLWREEKKSHETRESFQVWWVWRRREFLPFSPLPIICMLTMALDPGKPLVAITVFMLGTMRPGPTPWPIIGPAVAPMGPCGPQPCCMEPRIDPLFIMPGLRKTEIIRIWNNWCHFIYQNLIFLRRGK